VKKSKEGNTPRRAALGLGQGDVRRGVWSTQVQPRQGSLRAPAALQPVRFMLSTVATRSNRILSDRQRRRFLFSCCAPARQSNTILTSCSLRAAANVIGSCGAAACTCGGGYESRAAMRGGVAWYWARGGGGAAERVPLASGHAHEGRQARAFAPGPSHGRLAGPPPPRGQRGLGPGRQRGAGAPASVRGRPGQALGAGWRAFKKSGSRPAAAPSSTGANAICSPPSSSSSSSPLPAPSACFGVARGRGAAGSLALEGQEGGPSFGACCRARILTAPAAAPRALAASPPPPRGARLCAARRRRRRGRRGAQEE
jgi:hypothetical protein